LGSNTGVFSACSPLYCRRSIVLKASRMRAGLCAARYPTFSWYRYEELDSRPPDRAWLVALCLAIEGLILAPTPYVFTIATPLGIIGLLLFVEALTEHK
jgi:hypothetical protein